MWGLGCILAEMLFCANANKAAALGINQKQAGKVEEKRYLFPGLSCYPLSPCDHKKPGSDIWAVGKRDQLRLILEKLGHQDEQDTSFITEQ